MNIPTESLSACSATSHSKTRENSACWGARAYLSEMFFLSSFTSCLWLWLTSKFSHQFFCTMSHCHCQMSGIICGGFKDVSWGLLKWLSITLSLRLTSKLLWQVMRLTWCCWITEIQYNWAGEMVRELALLLSCGIHFSEYASLYY